MVSTVSGAVAVKAGAEQRSNTTLAFEGSTCPRNRKLIPLRRPEAMRPYCPITPSVCKYNYQTSCNIVESIDLLAALVRGTHHHSAHGQISELEDAGAGAGAGAGGCGGGGGGGGGHGNTGKR